MKKVELQRVGDGDCRSRAAEYRSDAAEYRNDAEGDCNAAAKPGAVVNMAQININNIVVSNTAIYRNGPFIPVFQDAIRAIACNTEVKPGTRRVLDYILGTVDENNCFNYGITDMASNLGCSVDTVERAMIQLVKMNIVCKKEGSRERSVYELSNKILNPRIAKKGNTRQLLKTDLPVLLDPTNGNPLIPTIFQDPDF